jgi:hypothetical protein
MARLRMSRIVGSCCRVVGRFWLGCVKVSPRPSIPSEGRGSGRQGGKEWKEESTSAPELYLYFL